MIKKIIIGILCFLVLAIVLSEYGRRQQEAMYPDIVIEKFEELKSRSDFADSLGYIVAFEYTYEYTDQLNRDTINVFITLTGVKRNLKYEGQYFERGKNWILIEDDVVIH